MEVYQSSKTAAELEYALGAVPSIGDNGNWFIGDQDTGIRAVAQDGDTPFVGENGNWWVGETDTGLFAAGINVIGAKVGQLVQISEVDENGVPTAWEAIDGIDKEWVKLAEVSLEEPTYSVVISKDIDGNPFEVKELLIRGLAVSESGSTGGNFMVNDGYIVGGIAIASSDTYFTPFEFYATSVNGRIKGECIISSYRQTTPTYSNVGTGNAAYYGAVPLHSGETIKKVNINCSNVSLKFGINSIFTFYGR